jgi:glycosyltransferase involved in cell wall biosynthesis
MARVALVTHYFAGHGGGIERAALEIGSRLARDYGAEVTWIAGGSDTPPLAHGIKCLAVRAWNWSERALGIPYPLWISPRVLLAVNRAIGAASAVHIHEYFYFGNILCFLLAKARRKPVLLTQHLGRFPIKSRLLRAARFVLEQTAGRLMLLHSDRVVFIAGGVEHYFAERFPRRAGRRLLIRNGVDSNLFHPLNPADRTRAREHLGIPPDRPFLLFVGRFVPKKGLAIIKKLAESFAGAQWVLVGWGEMRPEEWNLKNVTVKRGAEQAEIAPYYQSADLLVLPSTGEGFPLVIQESMACGTPALVSDEIVTGYEELREIITAAAHRGDEDTEEWRKVLAEFLDNPERAADLRARAAQFAQTHWSWDRAADAYHRALEEIAR